MFRLLMLLSMAGLAGCMHTYAVAVSEPSPNAHYVLIQSGASGKQKVYDCMSMPDGSTYDPMCTRVRFRDSAK